MRMLSKGWKKMPGKGYAKLRNECILRGNGICNICKRKLLNQ